MNEKSASLPAEKESVPLLPQMAAKCVYSLEHAKKKLQRPEMMEFWHQLALAIRNATHIVLPRNGEIYRQWEGQPMPEYEMEALACLPGPICTFEFASEDTDRVVIAWSHKQIGLYEADDVDDDTVSMTDVRLSTAAEFTRNVVEAFGENIWLPEQSRIVIHTKRGVSNLKVDGRNGMMIECSIHPDMRTEDECRELLASPQEFSNAYGRAIFAASQACVALRAGASLQERQEHRAMHRWKMEKRGVGGFTYHVLKLPEHVRSAGQGSGTHASPRLHVRRAHVRKLPTGHLTFVRQCFVGDRDRGTVKKHYEVRA